METFKDKVSRLFQRYEELITRKNIPIEKNNGIFTRYRNPVVTAAHTIYYASSDTRMHVATSTVDKLVDYCMNTPVDGLSSSASVETLKKLIDKNLKLKI